MKMEAILEQNGITELTISRNEEIVGKKISLFAQIFGCRHKRLSRPFSDQKSSYCACLECGARKHFNARTLKSSGSFYFPPATSFDISQTINQKSR